MKTSKMLGAVALTAALAMGTMPAFAAGEASNAPAPGNVGEATNVANITTSSDANNTTRTGTGSTTLWASTFVPQLNVTIPITMGVALPAIDGSIMFPDSTVYGIENNGDNPVTVVNVQAANATGFSVVKEASGSIPAVVAGGSANITINVDSVKNTTGAAIAVGTDTVAELNWQIPSGSELGIDLTGETKWKDATTPESFSNKITEIATLKYTVSSTVAKTA